MGNRSWRKKLCTELDTLFKEKPLSAEHWHNISWMVTKQIETLEKRMRSSRPLWFGTDTPIIQCTFDRGSDVLYVPQSGKIQEQLNKRVHAHEVYLYPHDKQKPYGVVHQTYTVREYAVAHTVPLIVMYKGIPLVEAYCWLGWKLNARACWVLEVQQIGHEWFKVDELPHQVFFALHGQHTQLLTTSLHVAYTFIFQEIQRKMQEK